MREETPFFWGEKRSEPLQAADCSRRSQTAAGSGRIMDRGGAACHSLPPSQNSGCSHRARRLMWPAVFRDLFTPEPLAFLWKNTRETIVSGVV